MTVDVTIHPTAEVSANSEIGPGTRIWHHAQVREDVQMGSHCIVGKGAYVDAGVQIGSRVKIQNYALVYQGASLEDGVFIGPHACLTNDKVPRAVTPTGELKREDDWQVGRITIRQGASVGAGAVVLPGVTIGCFAMVGAGAVVAMDVPDFGLVVGQPARLVGHVCRCGQRLDRAADGGDWCATCQERYDLV